MKSLFLKELAIGCCSLSLALFPMSSSAHHGGGGIGWGGAAAIGAGVALGAVLLSQPYQGEYYGPGPGPGYYGPPEEEEYSECEWVRGHHNRYGNWIPAHQECW